MTDLVAEKECMFTVFGLHAYYMKNPCWNQYLMWFICVLRSLFKIQLLSCLNSILLHQLFVIDWYFMTRPEGRAGISDVSPLFGISGLSIDSMLPPALLLFGLVLLLTSSKFTAFGPVPCLLSRNFVLFSFFLFFLEIIFYCMALEFRCDL